MKLSTHIRRRWIRTAVLGLAALAIAAPAANGAIPDSGRPAPLLRDVPAPQLSHPDEGTRGPASNEVRFPSMENVKQFTFDGVRALPGAPYFIPYETLPSHPVDGPRSGPVTAPAADAEPKPVVGIRQFPIATGETDWRSVWIAIGVGGGLALLTAGLVAFGRRHDRVAKA
jgi:hypothetical protein